MAEWAADPKPAKRLRATQADWSDLHQLFQHACCVSCGMRPIELHHVCPRSQGGDDVAENLVPLCRTCHTRLEGHESGWERVAAAIRPYVLLNRPRCVYVAGKLGWDRFNARYPMLGLEENAGVRGDGDGAASRRGQSTGSGRAFSSSSDEKPRQGAWDLEAPLDEWEETG